MELIEVINNVRVNYEKLIAQLIAENILLKQKIAELEIKENK